MYVYVLDNLNFDSLSDCWFMSYVRFSVSTFQSTRKWDRSPPPFFDCCLFEQVKTCKYWFALLYRMLICCSILPPFKSDWETFIWRGCWGNSAGSSLFWYPCEIPEEHQSGLTGVFSSEHTLFRSKQICTWWLLKMSSRTPFKEQKYNLSGIRNEENFFSLFFNAMFSLLVYCLTILCSMSEIPSNFATCLTNFIWFLFGENCHYNLEYDGLKKWIYLDLRLLRNVITWQEQENHRDSLLYWSPPRVTHCVPGQFRPIQML